MKFLIHCKSPETGEKEVWHFDNATNRIRNPHGRLVDFWNQAKFEGIREAGGALRPAFSAATPTKKSNRLRSLKIQLGLNCNYHCAYCSQAEHRQGKQRFPSRQDIDQFLAELDRQGIQLRDDGRIEFWGGEPLVYWKALEYLIPKMREKFSKDVSFSMISNGSLLTREKVDQLVKWRVSLTISHDGPGFPLRDDKNPLDDPEMKGIWGYCMEQMKANKLGFSFNVVLSPMSYDVRTVRNYFAEHFSPEARFGFEGIVNYHSDLNKAYHFNEEKIKTLQQSIFTELVTRWNDPAWQSLQGNVVRILEYLVFAVNSKKIYCHCDMADEQVLAVSLDGVCLSCHNCDSKHYSIGTLKNYPAVANDKFTHWSLRPNCKDCFCLSACSGACPYLSPHEHEVNCLNERIYYGAFFAVAWFLLTERVIERIEPEQGDGLS